MSRSSVLMGCCILVIVVSMLLAVGQANGQSRDEPSLSDFAWSVVEYDEGSGVGGDPVSGATYNDEQTALGRPTVDTTGDNWFLPPSAVVPVVPVYSAFRAFELVSIGQGGSLTLMFDHQVTNDPRNPYGVDFIVFGNAFQSTPFQTPWLNGDPNLTFTILQNGGLDPGEVSVSQYGETWYTFSANLGPHAIPDSEYSGTDGPYADVFAPTLGRIYDPLAPDTTIGEWNLWWSYPTDPTWPLDPRFSWSDFESRSVAEIVEIYEESAGGTAFDLDWLEVDGLDWIQYIRIENLGEGTVAEIDAVSDVFPHLGDFDRDGDVDLEDFASFQVCFTGADGPRSLRDCFAADFDANLPAGQTDVDLDDFAAFSSHLVGPVR